MEDREKLVFLRAFELADGSGPEDPVLNPITLPRCLDSFEEAAQLPVATPPVRGVPSRDLIPPQSPDLGRDLSLVGVWPQTWRRHANNAPSLQDAKQYG